MEGSVAGVSVWQHRKSEPPESAWAALVKDPGSSNQYQGSCLQNHSQRRVQTIDRKQKLF